MSTPDERFKAAVGRWLAAEGHDPVVGSIDIDVSADSGCDTCGGGVDVDVTFQVVGGGSKWVSINRYALGEWIGGLIPE